MTCSMCWTWRALAPATSSREVAVPLRIMLQLESLSARIALSTARLCPNPNFMLSSCPPYCLRTRPTRRVGGFDCIWDGGPTAHDRPAGLSSWLGTLPPSDARFEGMTKATGKAGAAVDEPATPHPESDVAVMPAAAAASGAGADAAATPAGIRVPPPIRGLAGVEPDRGVTTSPIVAGRQRRRD